MDMSNIRFKLEPFAGHYRIISTSLGNPVVFESALPADIMDTILYILESQVDEAYNDGYNEGYRNGWDEGFQEGAN